MSPSTGQSGGFNICIVPSMTASQRLGARCFISVYISFDSSFQDALSGRGSPRLLGAVPLPSGLPQVIFKIFSDPNQILRLSLPWFCKNPPDGIHYLGAFIRFMTIAFTTLVLVPLQMLQCVTVHFYFGFSLTQKRFRIVSCGGTTPRFTALISHGKRPPSSPSRSSRPSRFSPLF